MIRVGRRPRLNPAPDVSGLRERPVHEIVRDFPEALWLLRSEGVDVAAVGGAPLGSLDGSQALARLIVLAGSWRPLPPTSPSAGKVLSERSGAVVGPDSDRSDEGP